MRIASPLWMESSCSQAYHSATPSMSFTDTHLYSFANRDRVQSVLFRGQQRLPPSRMTTASPYNNYRVLLYLQSKQGLSSRVAN